jgi:hypothetical protein
MVYTNDRALDKSEINYMIHVAQYIVVACLTVSKTTILLLTPMANITSRRSCMQLCVWDWLLAISDEFEMLRHRQRPIGYLLNGVYLITR